MKTISKLRQTLQEGRIALGTCIDSHSPASVEVAGYSGLDFVRIDTEYSWRRDDSLEHMLRAATIAEITAMVRVEKGNPYLISKALQAGAGAILVTDIANYQEAVNVVKAAKFPPKGMRGYSSFSFSGKWGARGGKEWVDWSDAEIMVGVMIENEQVLNHINDIFAIDGLDFCLFGPADYSMSIGLGYPQRSNPKVQDAIQRTCEVASKHNKAVAIGIGEPWGSEAKSYIDMGCHIIEISHEFSILQSTWKSAISQINKKIGVTKT